MASENTFPVLDGHNDTLLRIVSDPASFFSEGQQGHLDLPRARRGGLAGGFFAIFSPAPEQQQSMQNNRVITATGYEVLPYPAIDHTYAQHHTIQIAASLFRLEAASAGQMKVVHTTDELEHCLQTGTLAIILHFEGAEAIDTQLDALDVFYQAGLRSLGIVWSRPNAFGHGVPFRYPHSPDTGPGLTAAGRDLVRACNHLGILIDLAHINEREFYDVARLSDAPLVVTHTAVHAICPSTRNLTDKQLDAIKASDGIVGLNFSVADLRPDAHRDPNTPLALMVQHIDYLVECVGIDKVAFGSDFDGGIMVAQALGDVTGLPNLIAALHERGYDDGALAKITHENWLRVLRKTWKL